MLSKAFVFMTASAGVLVAGLTCNSMCGENTICNEATGTCDASCGSISPCCNAGECIDSLYVDCVSRFDPWCGDNWDKQCADEAQMDCGLDCSGTTPTTTSPSPSVTCLEVDATGCSSNSDCCGSGSCITADIFNLVPNGDFNTPGGVDWVHIQSGGTWSYPSTGDNGGGGYAKFSHVSFGTSWGGGQGSSQFLPLGSLGLAVGDTPLLQWDAMTDVPGTLVRVFIESYGCCSDQPLEPSHDPSPNGGYTKAITGAENTWSTYQSTGSYTIPPLADSVKIVVVYDQGFAAGSPVNIGIDNVGVWGDGKKCNDAQ